MSKSLTIAIDGPAASGKSVVGSQMAKRLGVRFLDTGMMYRAFTWSALQAGIDRSDEKALAVLAKSMSMQSETRDGKDVLLVNGEDATPHVKSREVERAVSYVSAVSAVRRALVALQRQIAAEDSIVMVGRDIGTVVLKDATLKVFLRATVEERARRRYLELKRQGKQVDYEDVEAELARRDKIDSERADSPLQAAEDAVMVDTDHLSIGEVVEEIVELLGDR